MTQLEISLFPHMRVLGVASSPCLVPVTVDLLHRSAATLRLHRHLDKLPRNTSPGHFSPAIMKSFELLSQRRHVDTQSIFSYLTSGPNIPRTSMLL